MNHTVLENDWLLRLSRLGFLSLRYFLLGLAAVMGLVGALSLLAGIVGLVAPDLLAKLSDNPFELREALGMGALLTLLCFGLWMGSRYFALLAEIIGTVGEGDPFAAANADQLHAMAMINVVIAGISLAAAVGVLIVNRVWNVLVEELIGHIALDSFTLAILLFILARVFRKGTEMRADPEGTV